MFKMFSQFFSMLTLFFRAGEHTASALNHLAEAGDEEAEHFKNKRRLDRQKLLANVDEILEEESK